MFFSSLDTLKAFSIHVFITWSSMRANVRQVLTADAQAWSSWMWMILCRAVIDVTKP